MAAVYSSKLFSKLPIVVVLGATGTGKSKLAIQIAKRFEGEIINADSMQMYRGLDIATNKVTEDEQREIPHHLLGFLEPNEILTVSEFRNLALKSIRDISERKKLPVIVGGTNYYIESVLYDMLISGPNTVESGGEKTRHDVESSSSPDDVSGKTRLDNENRSEFEKLDNETLFQRLKEVDPERANVLHPNDRRKIIRCLEVYEQHGETLSSLLNKQRSTPGGCDVGGPLRFTNSIILWLTCESKILNERLDKRVDAMMDQGLIEELIQFHKAYSTELLSGNRSYIDAKGIFQSIGFKEFQEYLSLDGESRKSEQGSELLKKGTELLKIATRQYARRQYKWIASRYLKNSLRQIPPFYGLDATDVTRWDEDVYTKAETILEAHLEGKKPSIEPYPISNDRVGVDKTYKCEVCDRVVLGIHQWTAHIKGRKHYFAVRRKRRLKELEEEKSLNNKTVTDS